MKQTLSLLLLTALLAISCSKKSSDNVNPTNTNKVTINGTDYATVKIGTQTWTAVNYNGPGGVNYLSSSTNNPTYGKFYSLAEAQAINLPSGWRLPTKADVEKMLIYLGATGTNDIRVDGDSTVAIKLKSKSDWTYNQGNNSSGFNAYPAGELFFINSNINSGGIHELASFWTNSVDPYNDQYLLVISNTIDGTRLFNDVGMDYIPADRITGFEESIRFVKDN